MHPFFEGLAPTLHISHRGGAALAPENTMAAFRMAIETYRTDMLELDVHLTRDEYVVVAHDPTVDRCTDGRGAIAQLSLKELRALDAGARFPRFRGERIPTFEEVLHAFPRTRINVELKAHTEALIPRFVELVRREDAALRICCGSEHDDIARRLLGAIPEACQFFPRDALAEWVMTVKGGEPAPRMDGYTHLAMPDEFQGMNLVDEQLVRVARESGKWLSVWTINDEPSMRRLAELKVGGIMTDRPDLLRHVLG